jgi:hypothetical protein
MATGDGDRRAEMAAESSALFRAVEYLLGRWTTAWHQSATARLVADADAGWHGCTVVSRVRVIGGVTVVASGTTLLLRLLAGRYDPVTWLFPAGAAVVALLMLLRSRQLADAWEKKS